MTPTRRSSRGEGNDPLRRPAANAAKAEHYSLSERELDVLFLMQEGLFDQEIAYRLGVSKDAVAERVSLIVEKLGVRSRTEAALRAFREHVFGTET